MALYSGAYEYEVRTAFNEACRKLDLDLLLVYGGGIDEPHASSPAHNSIYGLVGHDSVDGVVAVTSSIGTCCGAERTRQFLERYGTIPTCSLGVEVPGVPSVVVDHRVGMLAAVEHIVGVHRYQRVAFIGGNPAHPDAKVRFEAYLDGLERHGIAFDSALVENGMFTRDGARTAMREILARRVAFDAVMAANDMMALGAIEVLREQGWLVPHDVAATGFDDLAVARIGSPPLTTVAQPFAAMAELAIELLLLQMKGTDVPLMHLLPSVLMVRQSCGCTARDARQRSLAPSCLDANPQMTFRQGRQTVQSAIAQVLSNGNLDGTSDATRLIDALLLALEGRPAVFLDALDSILERPGVVQERCHALQQTISFLREQLRLSDTIELEDFWHDARELVALFSARGEVTRRLEIDGSYYGTLFFGQQVSNATNLPSLKSSLELSLPATGVRTAWVSKFAASSTTELEPVAYLVNGTPLNSASTRFSASHLIAPEARARERRQTILIFPLACDTRNLGVAAFEYDPDVCGYPLMRDQVAAAVRTIELYEEVIHTTALHERSLQERAASARRMESLCVLAGGVAHDLNNVLGPLVGLPDVMLAELAQFDGRPQSTAVLRADLETMRSASLRASQTIKDLLTLSRQGRTVKERLDLNRTTLDCLGTMSAHGLRETYPRLSITYDTARVPLVVCGSETHIARAVTNLVRNALEAMAGAGEVRIKTFEVTLAQPVRGYETVPAGNYAVVAVSDTGVGIASHEIGWIFEPFTSKKRMSETNGTGLGLAIVHGVIKEHEGFVDVVSEVGVGTTFTLYFPRVKESLLPDEGGVAATNGGSARILVVDDEPVQLRTARRLLTPLGYFVETVSSGEAAVSLFAEASSLGRSPFDLVLLDMILGGCLDGLQVFDEIRRQFPMQRGIVVSGHAPNERVERALAEGLCWLAKPYTGQDLANAVGEALAGYVPDADRRSSSKIRCLSPSRLLP